jgi:hypothetical protein
MPDVEKSDKMTARKRWLSAAVAGQAQWWL